MNDAHLNALAGIQHALSEPCHLLNAQRDIGTAAKLIPAFDRLTHLLIEIREN